MDLESGAAVLIEPTHDGRIDLERDLPVTQISLDRSEVLPGRRTDDKWSTPR
jgi:hypothetical protein